MVVHIIKSKQFKEEVGHLNENSIHYVPCKIHSDGPANVSKYFSNLITTENKGLQVSFRGYPLNGSVIHLPTGYKGLVLKEINKQISEDDRNFHVIHTFDSLTYWNWDKYPSKNDAFLSALDWIDIADAIHSPIEEKTVEDS